MSLSHLETEYPAEKDVGRPKAEAEPGAGLGSLAQGVSSWPILARLSGNVLTSYHRVSLLMARLHLPIITC